jgi:DNA-binding NtrC family response regulator
MNLVDVLLIDDNEALPIRESMMAGHLEQFRITRKATLSQGLDALQGSCFQLILLDLSLPDASVAESVTKAVKMAPDLPLIALIDEGETAKVAEAIRLGAQDYVLKGCRCDSLDRAMHFAMERKRLVAEREDVRQLMEKEKSGLVAHLSHEVRNALACIHQFGNILIDGLAGKLSEEQCEYLGIMLENASQIRKVLDSLLEPQASSVGRLLTENESPSKTKD